MVKVISIGAMKESKKFSYLASFFLILALATIFRVSCDPATSTSRELYSFINGDRILSWILFFAMISFLFVFMLSPSESHSFHFLQSRPYKTDSKLHALILSFILSFLHPFVQEFFFATHGIFNHTLGIEYFFPLIFSLTIFQIISICQQPLHHHSSNYLVYNMVTNIWSQVALLVLIVVLEIGIFGISGLYFVSAQLFGLVLFLPSHRTEAAEPTRFEKVVSGDNRVLSVRVVFLLAGLFFFVVAMGWSVKNVLNNFSLGEKTLSSLIWIQSFTYMLSKVPVQVISFLIHIADIFRILLTVPKDAHVEIAMNTLPYYIKHLNEVLLHQYPVFHKILLLWESFAYISATLAVCSLSTFFPVALSTFVFPITMPTSLDSFSNNLNSVAKRAVRRSKKLSEKAININPNFSSMNMNNIGYSQYSAQLQQLNISEYNPVSQGDCTMLQQALYFVAPMVLFFCFYTACRECLHLLVKGKHRAKQIKLSRWIIAYLSIISWSGAVLTSGTMGTNGTHGQLTFLSIITSNNKVIIAMIQKSLSVWLLVFLVSIYAPMLSDLVQYFIPRHTDDDSNVTIVVSHHSDNSSTNVTGDETDLNNGFLGTHHLRLRTTNSNNSSLREKIITNVLYAAVSYCVVKQMMHRYLRGCE